MNQYHLIRMHAVAVELGRMHGPAFALAFLEDYYGAASHSDSQKRKQADNCMSCRPELPGISRR
jgi:hypothetical protein